MAPWDLGVRAGSVEVVSEESIRVLLIRAYLECMKLRGGSGPRAVFCAPHLYSELCKEMQDGQLYHDLGVPLPPEPVWIVIAGVKHYRGWDTMGAALIYV